MKTTNIFYRALCLVLMALCSVCGFAQTDPADQLLKTIVHPSPQSAAYARYGEYPVDHSTGVPKIEIPLYTLNTGDYELPITLSYHASGIKVMDVSGPVGLGWVLNAGGVISRTVCGAPDGSSIFFKNVHDVESRLSESGMSTDEWTRYFNGAVEYDSESDRYSYNFGGKAGLFRLDANTMTPYTIPYEPLKIERLTNGFRITDTDGSIYTFDKAEHCTEPVFFGQTSAWYLTSIVTGGKKQTITFNYGKTATQMIRYRTEVRNYGTVLTYDAYDTTFGEYPITQQFYQLQGDPKYQTYTYSTPVVTSIMWNDVVIEFSYTDDRIDGQKTRLSSISVKDNGNEIRYISLGNSSNFGNNVNTYRMRLDNVSIKGTANGSESELYGFTYNSMIPAEHYNLNLSLVDNPHCSEDYWGYYNNGDTYTMIPEGAIACGTGWADRSPVEQYMKMCSLESITYPTGGTTTFTMEANRVTSGMMGGLRVKSIINKDSNGMVLETKSYEYAGYATMDVNLDLFSYTDEFWYFIRQHNGAYQSHCTTHQIGMASPILPLTGRGGSPVFYHTVTEYMGTSSSNTGKLVYHYVEDDESSRPGAESEEDNPYPQPLRFYSELYNYDEGTIPALLTSKEVYRNDNGSYTKQQTETYTYTELSSGRDSVSLGMRVGRLGVGVIYNEDQMFSPAPYPDMDTFYGSIVYSPVYGYMKKRLLTGKTVTNHETGHTISHTYLYNDTLGCMLPVEEHITNSDGNEYTTRTVYPFMLEDGVSRNMADSNMVDIPIKVEKLCGNTLLSTDHTVYTQTEGMFLPQKQNRTEGGETRTLHTYEMYDSKGNPLYVTTLDGRKFVFLWGYGNRYPVARIEGATYNEVEIWVGNTLINSLKTATGSSVATILGNIRNSLSNRDVLVTTYTYTPGVGMTSVTAPNGQKTTYTYDSLNRLSHVRDDNGQIVNQYDYNYQQ